MAVDHENLNYVRLKTKMTQKPTSGYAFQNYYRCNAVTILSLLATTVMNGNDCFKNGEDRSKWQRPFTKRKNCFAVVFASAS